MSMKLQYENAGKIKIFLALNHSNVIILLLKVKMPAIVGILTFMSMINFVLSRIENEKCSSERIAKL